MNTVDPLLSPAGGSPATISAQADPPAPAAAFAARDNSFFGHWRTELTRFFRRRLSDRDEAEDRAHEVLLAILEMTDWAAVRDPRSYLYSAARHLLYQQWTERRRFREFIADRQRIAEVLGELHTAQRDPLGRALLVDEEMDRALARLDSDARAAAELWLSGFSYTEIAAELSLSVHKVKRKLALARERLLPLASTLTQG